MSSDRFQERWIQLEDGRSMCALIHGELGWLMYLREEGDAGLTSRNPNYTGPEEAMTEYRLGNGQRDFYPTAQAYDKRIVERALAHFELHRSLPDFIEWHDDAED